MMHVTKILNDFIVKQVVSCNLIDWLVLVPTLLEGNFGVGNLQVQWSISGIWQADHFVIDKFFSADCSAPDK